MKYIIMYQSVTARQLAERIPEVAWVLEKKMSRARTKVVWSLHWSWLLLLLLISPVSLREKRTRLDRILKTMHGWARNFELAITGLHPRGTFLLYQITKRLEVVLYRTVLSKVYNSPLYSCEAGVDSVFMQNSLFFVWKSYKCSCAK